MFPGPAAPNVDARPWEPSQSAFGQTFAPAPSGDTFDTFDTFARPPPAPSTRAFGDAFS